MGKISASQLNSNNFSNISIKKEIEKNGKILHFQRGPIIEDILQTQNSTIGQLHFSTSTRNDGYLNRLMRTVFTTSSGGANGSINDKVVRNNDPTNWLRINYNLKSEDVLSKFTVTFDARLNNNFDGYGFYWNAKGTYNPNSNQTYTSCAEYECIAGVCLYQVCDDWDVCFEFDQDGYCTDWSDCYNEVCLDFDCYTYGTNCLNYNNTPNFDSFPGSPYEYLGNDPDYDGYMVFFNAYENKIIVYWGSAYIYNISSVANISTQLQNPGNLKDGKWRNHKIQYDGNLIKIFIDNKLHLTAFDPNSIIRNKFGKNFGLFAGQAVSPGPVGYSELRNFKFYDKIV